MKQAIGDAASVVVSAIDEPSRHWSANVPGTEASIVRGLPPAAYRVTVTFANAKTASLDVTVGAAEIVSMEGQPATGVGGDGSLQVVDRSRLADGTYFGAQSLRDLPNGAGVWGLVDAAAPFVIVDRMDTGGLGLGAAGRVGSRAASSTSSSLVLGEFPVSSSSRSADQLLFMPDVSTFDAVDVASGLASVDLTQPGATTTLVARRPPASRQGAVGLGFTGPALVSSNDRVGVPSIERLTSWRGGEVQFGTPIASGAGVFVSGSMSGIEKQERGVPARVASHVNSVFAHVVAAPAAHTEIRILGSVQSVGRPYGGHPEFLNTNITEQDLFGQSQATWDHWRTNGSLMEAAVGYQRGTFTPAGALGPGTSIDRVINGVVPAPFTDDVTDRWDERLAFAMSEVHRHALRMTFALSQSGSRSHMLPTPPVAELVDGLPARVWIAGTPATDSRRSLRSLSASLTDRLAATDRLTIDLGIRFSRSSGSAQGATDAITWGGVLPRASMRWVTPALTVFGGYGRYQTEPSFQALASGDPGEPVRDVYRWNDLDRNGRFDDGELGELVARAGRGAAVASIDPALVAPHTDEFSIGVERRLGAKMMIRATRIARREHALLASVNVGVPASSYLVRLIPDRGEDYDSAGDDRLLAVYDRLPSSFGQDRYVLKNIPDDQALYDGTEIAWELKGGRWWSMAGASSYLTFVLGGNRGNRPDENDQGVIGELYENPNASSYARGASFFDRQYVLKWATSYHAPHDILVAAAARYQDGQPFSRLLVVPDLAQGPELVNTYRAGRTRFTFTATVDARLEKGFKFRGRRAAVRIDVFNLTNLGNEVEENPVSGPGFRDTTAVQPPRTARVGFRFEF